MSHRIRRRALATAVLAVLTVAALAASAADDRTTRGAPRLAYGAARALGQGSARTYVTLDDEGAPVALGVAISESAMSDMPADAMLMLPVPTAATRVGYDHVMLGWNPQGAEPGHASTPSHLDFHFYTVDATVASARLASDAPTARYQPAGYVELAAGVRVAIPEPAAESLELDGRRFTRTFVYGAFDGQFVAFEPVITRATIDSARAHGRAAEILRLPGAHGRSGRYATSYAVTYDAAAKEYRLSLDALTAR